MTLWCWFTCVLSVSLQECKLRDTEYHAHRDSKALSSVLLAGTMATVEETDCLLSAMDQESHAIDLDAYYSFKWRCPVGNGAREYEAQWTHLL